MAYEPELFQASGKLQRTTIVNDVAPLGDSVLATEMNFGNRTLNSGILLASDDGTTAGIRPRWAKVFRVGPDQKDVRVDDWILVEHGRWSRGLKIEMNGETITLRRIDPTAIIGFQVQEPTADETLSTAVQAQLKTRD